MTKSHRAAEDLLTDAERLYTQHLACAVAQKNVREAAEKVCTEGTDHPEFAERCRELRLFLEIERRERAAFDALLAQSIVEKSGV